MNIFLKTLTACLLLFIALSCTNSEEVNPIDKKHTTNTQQAEETTKPTAELSEKRKSLTALIGTHSLVSISGATGANTMLDYYQENGKWTALGSSIYQARREAFDIGISEDDLQKLKSLKVQVSKNLTVSVLCNGKTYLKAPFVENGFTYLLKKAPKDYIQEQYIPEKLKASSIFLNDYLFLYAEDFISQEKLGAIDIAQVGADVAVLMYSMKTKQFELCLADQYQPFLFLLF
jgi:hypothetical protein